MIQLKLFDNRSYSETELLLHISQGDETAFRQLYNDYSNKLYAYVYALTRRKDLTEDLIQNIFLKLWHRRTTLTSINDFSAYLFRMAKNDVITAVRQAALEQTILQKGLPAAAPEQLPDDQLQEAQLRDAWEKAIQQLPPQQQKIYVLQKQYGWKINDIAKHLNLSSLTVKRHLSISKQAVRENMAQRLLPKELMVILFLGSMNAL
ncbi:sigma-70 family RNA polymerase sigma factor [Pseudoflavitalea sp. G-6-1-2]|uniref:RNA polymerase sigma factor n=1 Tax=Pseudoflavitalea sp. G-6-1-2 TaxID=2728841 RepID=UPI00146BBA42|nr:sigma-70 family RNA polymerase sigma factor [Pseudoflavitalea sp. G-6-1-2]NML19259.1 sigma-70 family RNA polymerase sigma factor [Pseudoflavitalea sp. G-6-1-2]